MSLLSNLSYTNKDFNSIYNELLDLVSKISPSWNPGSSTDGSNESDPGVLLLKLDALLADKNNYNIDKNVLELFPDSVTQYPNARELYEQCGYIMPYYQAAEAYITLSVKGTSHLTSEDQGKITNGVTVKYSFDPFLEIVNDDATRKYVIVDPDISIYSDSSTNDFKALQGTRVTYNINGNNVITLSDLDYNNRLYFKETNIAENGIFIHHLDSDGLPNYATSEDWKKVDNLLTEQQNSLCYKFGVSRDASQCYIEFPSDIANLIGSGIHIDYILTDGYKGNTNKYTLKKFASESPNVHVSIGSKPSDTEYTATINSSPESNQIQVIITNYQDSYNGADPETLESARKNYERTKNTFNTLVSLSDYTNFVLNSNRVSNGFVCDRTNDIQSTTKIVTSDGDITRTISQVAVKTDSTPEMTAFNLRHYLLKDSSNSTPDQFDIGFELVAYSSIVAQNLRADLDDIKTIQHDFIGQKDDDIANIQLRYPINVKIFPYNKIDTKAQLEIQEKIVANLLKVLNSKEMEYGTEVDYDLIYDTIINSDNRIKTIILEDFDYTAFVASIDSNGVTQYTQLDLEGSSSEAQKAANYCNTINAKAVLSGVSKLYELSDNFHYTVLQTPCTNTTNITNNSNSPYINNIGKVNTETKLTLKPQEGKASITLKENENVYLTAPNYITKDTYSTYVKYFYKFNDESKEVNKDSIYTLGDGEYIAFFWKDSDEDEDYKYAKYGKNTIISPSFKLLDSTKIPTTDDSKAAYFTAIIGDATNTGFITNLSETSEAQVPSTTASVNDQFYTYSQIIAKCDQDVILSGTKQINIKDLNTITLKHDTHKLYWILNKTEKSTTSNKDSYVLKFDNNKYTLKSGEYLFYAPFDDSYFALLGAGTELHIDGTIDTAYVPPSIEVEARTYEEVLYGKDSLLGTEGLWYFLGDNLQIVAKEMQFYNLGKDTTLTFSNITGNIEIDSSSIKVGTSTLPNTVNISYQTPSDKAPINLPTIQAQDSWTGYSILNLNSKPNKGQTLLYENDPTYTRKQSITIVEKYDGNAFTSIPSTNQIEIKPDSTIRNLKFECGYALDTLGGSNIDITAINLLGQRFANSFYCYTEENTNNVINNRLRVNLNSAITPLPIKKPSIDTKEVVLLPIQTLKDYDNAYFYSSDSSKEQELSSTTTSYTVTEDNIIFIPTGGVISANADIFYYQDDSKKISEDNLIPAGVYEISANTVLSFNTTQKTVEKVKIGLITTDGLIYTPFNKTSSNMKVRGMYYFKFDSDNYPDPSNTPLGLFVSPYDQASDIYIHPLVKYKYEGTTDPLEVDADNIKIINKIKELDILGQFNYTYQVSDNDLIKDPIVAKTFLYSNHPYNSCTICKWDHENSNIQIVNKAR